MSFVTTTVMNEGKIAKGKDRPIEANPYPADSRERADWLEGYNFDDAQMSVEREDPTDRSQS
ncbi:hypothetical protein OCOJLMKI_3338 [Methylobacterium iners]|uniref:Uncharacterized protein n=2 Tax=Methylobacterium iners TaxID=418707 RepID=A0ABQ4S355_9HYPH|nr:hypothetical protein OCOJLMKI_3338 [Methylobacterium iners]